MKNRRPRTANRSSPAKLLIFLGIISLFSTAVIISQFSATNLDTRSRAVLTYSPSSTLTPTPRCGSIPTPGVIYCCTDQDCKNVLGIPNVYCILSSHRCDFTSPSPSPSPTPVCGSYWPGTTDTYCCAGTDCGLDLAWRCYSHRCQYSYASPTPACVPCASGGTSSGYTRYCLKKSDGSWAWQYVKTCSYSQLGTLQECLVDAAGAGIQKCQRRQDCTSIYAWSSCEKGYLTPTPIPTLPNLCSPACSTKSCWGGRKTCYFNGKSGRNEWSDCGKTCQLGSASRSCVYFYLGAPLHGIERCVPIPKSSGQACGFGYWVCDISPVSN